MSREFQTGPEKTEGTQRETFVADEDVKGLLTQILKQLKIMNLHLSIVSDEEINGRDI